MLNSDDFTQMQTDLLAIRDDRPAEVWLRRGNTDIPSQTVRIARAGSRGQRRQNVAGEESRIDVIVLGAVDMDIQIGDRFTDGGILYEVKVIRPHRDVATMAECEAVE